MIVKKKSDGFRISQPADFDKKINGGDGCYSIQLSDIWSDTVVETVHFQPQVVKAIFNMSRASTSIKPVAEVGGFLGGDYTQLGSKYHLFINYFQPIENPAYSDTFCLEFGSDWFNALSDIQDSNPDLNVLGWFHTHPGHTPFLSKIDLSMHCGFFRSPFQIAIVLDPLVKFFQANIFCQKQNGHMNNQGDQKTWLYWEKIVESL